MLDGLQGSDLLHMPETNKRSQLAVSETDSASRLLWVPWLVAPLATLMS